MAALSPDKDTDVSPVVDLIVLLGLSVGELKEKPCSATLEG